MKGACSLPEQAFAIIEQHDRACERGCAEQVPKQRLERGPALQKPGDQCDQERPTQPMSDRVRERRLASPGRPGEEQVEATA